MSNARKSNIKNILLSVYRKVDLFGRSITNLKYVDELSDKLKQSGFCPDVVLSTSDPKSSHLLGNKLMAKKILTCPYVQYWGDPLALDIASQSILPIWIKKLVESCILKRADVVAYVSPLTANEQKEYFKKYANKIIFSPTPCEIKIYKECDCSLIVGYFGSYNSSVRNILPLYEAVSNMAEVKMYVIGDSDVKLEGKENITIIDRVPAEELDRFYEMCGVIIDLMNYKGAQVPAKIYRDAGTNKEVLLISDSKRSNEILNYFGQFDRYTICRIDVVDISSMLNRYLENGVPNRKPLQEFNYTSVSRRLIEDSIEIISR